MSNKIFGREPAVIIGLIQAGLALAVLTFWDLTGEQTGLIMAAVVAVFGVITALATHDVTLSVVTGFTQAVLALFLGFGAELSAEVVAGVVAFVAAAYALFTRTQTSPTPELSFTSEQPVA